jgi:hypothetical protein
MKHENMCIMGKETHSVNRRMFMRVCSDMDRCVNNQIKDYDTIESLFQELDKALD